MINYPILVVLGASWWMQKDPTSCVSVSPTPYMYRCTGSKAKGGAYSLILQQFRHAIACAGVVRGNVQLRRRRFHDVRGSPEEAHDAAESDNTPKYPQLPITPPIFSAVICHMDMQHFNNIATDFDTTFRKSFHILSICYCIYQQYSRYNTTAHRITI